ncbi:hypothetical protein NIES2101_41870 [Calothrix sp. HK-06]|nr:hypothetical protein NIES2101_41870 [Calothrix sp. HK-06]
MARTKGTVTGANMKQSNRGKRGGLTGSKHFAENQEVELTQEEISAISKERTENAASRIRERFENMGNTVKTASDTLTEVVTGVTSGASKVARQVLKEGSPLVTAEPDKALQVAKEIATNYGVNLTDVNTHLSASNDCVDESLGEGISAKELNRQKLQIQKQNNQIDLRTDRIKQKRKQVGQYKEELSLVGDLVDIATVEVKNAEKVVNLQSAITEFKTSQSKLEEKEELLIQQHVTTQGTINLTDGIRKEWDLKYELQQRKNEELELKIEGAIQKNTITRLELDAILFDEN